MQAQSSGFLRLRRKIPLLFGEKSFETVCFDSFILTQFPKLSWRATLRRRRNFGI
jgi:hypothetical protein